MTFETGTGFAPAPKGRKAGSKNKQTATRDAAIAEGREYRNQGVTLEEAAAKVNSKFKLNLTDKYVGELISGSK